MNFDRPPPPPRKGKGKKKGRLKPEDVQEDNPELAAFLRERRKAEARMNDAGELDYYLCIVFQSKQQKEEALDAIPGEVRVLYDMYVDGEALWAALGLEGVTPNQFGPMQSPLNKRLTGRTGIPDQGTDKAADEFWGF